MEKKTKKAKEQNNKKKSLLICYFYQKLNPNYSIKTITKKINLLYLLICTKKEVYILDLI